MVCCFSVLSVLSSCGSDERAGEAQVAHATSAVLVASNETKIHASDGAANDHLGRAVGISGDTIALGVPDDSTGLSGNGSVRVFVRSGTTWAPQAMLTAVVAKLGSSVAIDGDTVIAGAPQTWSSSSSWAGAAVVFTRSGSTWAEQATLIGAGDINEEFGGAVALQGDRAIVGATGGAGLKGSAYVFERVGTKWGKFGLAAGDLTLANEYGATVAISGDTALVGAPGQLAYSGAVYVFVRTATGWSQQAKLKPSTLVAGDVFGEAVAVSGDTALIGAPESDSSAAKSSGVVYVFVRTGTTWEQKAVLEAADATSSDYFGGSVGLLGDAAVVGARWSGGYVGAAYLFQGSGAVWTQQAKLVASDPAYQDYLGAAASIGGDAVVLGAPGDDYGALDSGSAYVFSVKASQGSTCTMASGCESGFCVDGVCCDGDCGGGMADCQACSTGAGAPVDGTCAILGSQTTCRAAVGTCDVAETCDGASSACPADGFATAGTPCDDGDICSTSEACDGKGACTPTTTLDCADQNECTTDFCISGTGCAHPAKNNGTACSTGICIAGKCTAPADGGVGGAGGQTGGTAGVAGSTITGGTSSGGGASGGAAGASSSGGSADEGGCGCRVASDRKRRLPLWLGLCLATLALARTRRRGRPLVRRLPP